MSVILAGPAIRQQQARGCDAVFAKPFGYGRYGSEKTGAAPAFVEGAPDILNLELDVGYGSHEASVTRLSAWLRPCYR